MKFSERLKFQRKIKGFTQKDVAEHVGVSKVAVSRWELGHSSPSGNILEDVSRFLDTTSGWLLNGDGFNEVSMIKFYSNVEASAGNGFMNSNEDSELVPIPKKVIDAQQSKESVCCIRVTGNSMEPVLLNGSIIALNPTAKVIKDGMMYVIRQGDLLRVKILIETPDKLIIRSYNKEFKDEVYTKSEISDLEVIGQVFWYSSHINL
ncbi:XRE family transcriptional regulator [Vibrio mediterranei]|uniref:XRE family transcriptional regulator n=1 Tax=Vibrio mediterranei TaxID=689 RepID=UPI001EFD26DF|nr:S24 family peptidase [Vibrio mediterranei]MCG9660102.1 helix-turn-helix domain-containing protein [Vibrio mediterranei]